MKVLDKSPLPYVPAWRMTSNHLRQRMPLYRKKVEEERKAAENNQQRPEEWR